MTLDEDTNIKQKEAHFHDSRLLKRELGDRVAQSKYYWAVESQDDHFWQTVQTHASHKRVLEIGCFDGSRTVELAAIADKVFAIDVSPVAVALTLSQVQDLRLANVEVCLGDAEKLDFLDASLDVVFCAGVLHHLNVEAALREIHRVLTPRGHAIFREPLAHNPLIHLYRKLTPDARTADEHPLSVHDLRLMRKIFEYSSFDYFGMFSLFATPLRNTAMGNPVRKLLNHVDDWVFNNSVLGRYCWQVNGVLRKH
ncbi:MAG: methyltransferase domain-containing protein [Steroidobacteraceae bacterium]